VKAVSGFADAIRFAANCMTLCIADQACADCVKLVPSARTRCYTKVCSPSYEYDIRIDVRRMEQFVLVELCCPLGWPEPGVSWGSAS
jgi:hypothetical protein